MTLTVRAVADALDGAADDRPARAESGAPR